MKSIKKNFILAVVIGTMAVTPCLGKSRSQPVVVEKQVVVVERPRRSGWAKFVAGLYIFGLCCDVAVAVLDGVGCIAGIASRGGHRRHRHHGWKHGKHHRHKRHHKKFGIR